MTRRKYFNSSVRNATNLLNELKQSEIEARRRPIDKHTEILVTDIRDTDTEYAEKLYEQYNKQD